MINIVIPLGRGSRWQNNELRYCLRSIEKHLTCWNKIIIVGILPDWIKENERLVFIPAEDRIGAKYKEENIHRKILKAIDSVYINGDFLFMNDDHFLLQDFEASEFPYHHKGLLGKSISETSLNNPYSKTLRNTYKLLGNVNNYDTHCPIIYDSGKYLNTFTKPFPAYGYAIKTMYCAVNKIEGEYYPDCKLGAGEIDSAILRRDYFSIGNKAIGEALECFLKELYPVPSVFEIV